MMEDNIVSCKNICMTYPSADGGANVLKDINFEVRENEFVVLFGPGQCGKTTMVNIIAGLLAPTSGTTTVDGKEVEGPGADRGVVFQTIALFPWLTVMQNVEYGPKVRGIDREERRKRAQYFIDLVGLSGFENTYPVKLSGGMKQRVGIARAYCNDPRVLLMDEPFGALDAQTRYLMEEELEKIWEKEKKTIIFITNNIEEALYLADKVVVFSNCPAHIKKEYLVDMPRPRDYVSARFLELRKEINSVVDITR
ncbi:ABC transporter ATP-binding protein [Diplocloster hominis]|uniref:ABC transporter ATP-binding protein n=1 Tax=Diplocloster hominis TaxID=3079010 RepID=UPI0031BA7FEC